MKGHTNYPGLTMVEYDVCTKGHYVFMDEKEEKCPTCKVVHVVVLSCGVVSTHQYDFPGTTSRPQRQTVARVLLLSYHRVDQTQVGIKGLVKDV